MKQENLHLILILLILINNFADCITPFSSSTKSSSKTLKWSDASSWINSQLPNAYSNVVIDKSSWIVVDKPISHISNLIINGKLSILEGTVDITLVANYIQVNGVFEIINNNKYNLSIV